MGRNDRNRIFCSDTNKLIIDMSLISNITLTHHLKIIILTTEYILIFTNSLEDKLLTTTSGNMLCNLSEMITRKRDNIRMILSKQIKINTRTINIISFQLRNSHNLNQVTISFNARSEKNNLVEII